MAELERRGITVSLEETAISIDPTVGRLVTDRREIDYGHLVLAPGRGGFRFLQTMMHQVGIPYQDNIVDIGIRVEMLAHRYPIVAECYDPKFFFSGGVRTFCMNSGAAYVVKEQYTAPDGSAISASTATPTARRTTGAGW